MTSATMLEESPIENPETPLSERLTGLLRQAGAAAVVIALGAFLLRGWTGANDILKFALLLASTVGIGGIAVVVAKTLQETKGPRLLLSLALGAIPINFAVLGAFLLHATQLHAGAAIPDYLAWSIDGLASAGLLAAISLVSLVPVMLFGFKTLARGISLPLSGVFLAGNLALLVPLRDPWFVTVIAIVLGSVVLYVTTRALRERLEARTLEGRVALMLQYLPLGILLGRSLWLYDAADIVMLAMSGLLFVLLRQVSLMFEESSAVRGILNACSIVPVYLSCGLMFGVVDSAGLDDGFMFFLPTLLGAGMIYELTRRDDRKAFRFIGLSLFVVGTTIAILVNNSFAFVAFAFAIGVLLLWLAFQNSQRALLYTGGYTLLTLAIHVAVQLITTFDLGSWISLLIVGVAAIVIASAIDAHGDRLQDVWQSKRRTLSAWDF